MNFKITFMFSKYIDISLSEKIHVMMLNKPIRGKIDFPTSACRIDWSNSLILVQKMAFTSLIVIKASI